MAKWESGEWWQANEASGLKTLDRPDLIWCEKKGNQHKFWTWPYGSVIWEF